MGGGVNKAQRLLERQQIMQKPEAADREVDDI